jgi:hypothetical protein
MIRFLLVFLSWFSAFFRSRHDLGLELVALRQQVGILKRKNPRPRLILWDRLLWLSFAVSGRNERVGDRETGDRRRLVSRRVPRVLALPFASPPRPTENHPRGSQSYPIGGG